MHLAACAKVNLFLRVVGRRTDGYHDLETIFQSISLCDGVTLEPTDEPWSAARVCLTCDDPGVPADAANLAWRAAVALAGLAGGVPLPGVRIGLSKRIPAGGGLGGGSSDAAAVLAGLRRLWRLDVPDATLAEIGARLGADVPFFLLGGTALGTGRGDVLASLPPLPALDLVLVTPPFGVNTAWAYSRRVEAAGDAPSVTQFQAACQAGPEAISAVLRNDLEAGVIREFPEIEGIRRELLGAGALGARMTGSGSTVFGIARDADHAARLAEHMTRPGRRVAVVRTLSSEAVRGCTRGCFSARVECQTTDHRRPTTGSVRGGRSSPGRTRTGPVGDSDIERG
jgi:4-diphosphocytidyl-2-C-methyl-D-erythritol kinase